MPPRSTNLLAVGAAEAKRATELERCKKDLYYLLTAKLGYAWSDKHERGLTRELHWYVCRWLDRMRENDEHFVMLQMGRGKHKTTLVVGMLIQDFLNDPNGASAYFHAVDALASDLVSEVGNHCQHGKHLRKLDPLSIDEEGNPFRHFPGTNVKKFVVADQFTLRRTRFNRFPTLIGRGAGAEVTGMHVNRRSYLDDIIGKKAIEESGVNKIGDWVENTILPVTDSRKLMVTCTPWPWVGDTCYDRWKKDQEWCSLVIPSSIEMGCEAFKSTDWTQRKIHFEPNYKLDGPVYGPPAYWGKEKKNLLRDQRQMRSNFGPQIMCDATPTSERAWNQLSCETYCRIRQANGVPGASEGAGLVVVLSDPAPFMSGSYRSLAEKLRDDGTKDYWSLAVVRIRVRNDLLEAILLDGAHSQEWGEEEGCSVAAGLMKKYRTNIFISEDPDLYFERMIAACRQVGVSYRKAKNGGPHKFAIFNKANRKRQAFTALATMARDGLFYICEESCSKEYLHGDGDHSGFLTQARKLVYQPDGKSNLRYDDDADVVSRLTDPVIRELAPMPGINKIDSPWNPLNDGEQPHEEPYIRSRYCAI